MTERKTTRKHQIFNFLEQSFPQIYSTNARDCLAAGLHAQQIADCLRLGRENVSRELNRLADESRAIKIGGKPVCYLPRKRLEEALRIPMAQCSFATRDEFLHHIETATATFLSEAENYADPPRAKAAVAKQNFDVMIGAGGSLKKQIKQAIAAIIYPGNGLHTFLIGPTGVGKTTFAELMYHYAVETGRLKEKAPYVIFNCADYAGNPQLLLSHLFGHVKGAFTGAQHEKKGLVDEADGGILFLDEVHRLPPEGQEMLFSLMDRNRFRRLGESGLTHEAQVFIVSATTENPGKSVLNTFLRRIPCVITLPGLAERPLKERMQLISMFFTEESKKIKLPVTVSTEVLKLFLLYDCKGNIGQLKNDVQLTCANAFVDYISGNRSQIYIKLSQMSDRFRDGIFILRQKRGEIFKNFDFPATGELTFNAETSAAQNPLEKILLHDDYKTGEDFYENILDTSRQYFDEGKPLEEIKRNINLQVEAYFQKHPYQQTTVLPDENQRILSKFVQQKIVTAVKNILSKVSDDLPEAVDTKIVYGLTLHIETLFERIKSGNYRPRKHFAIAASPLPEDEKITETIHSILETTFDLPVPSEEAAFIAVFLQALGHSRNKAAIGVLVMSHGDATASSMADVANRLLDTDHVKAIDMPLTASVHETLDKAIEVVKNMQHRQKGILLLVDMGSLVSFADVIVEKTKIPIQTVKMVSTPMVIEAARKSLLPGITLETLAEEVESTSQYLGRSVALGDAETIGVASSSGVDWFDQDRKRMMDLLEEVLIFLNPGKAYRLLDQVYRDLLQRLRIPPDQGLKVKFIFHNISMLERVISRETFNNPRAMGILRSQKKRCAEIKKAFSPVENAFGIKIPDAEYAYIIELLQIYLQPS